MASVLSPNDLAVASYNDLDCKDVDVLISPTDSCLEEWPADAKLNGM